MSAGPTSSRRPRLTVGVKVWLGVIVIVSLSSAILFFELADRERARLVEAKVATAVMVTDLLAASLVAPLDFDDQVAVAAALAWIKANREVQWAGVSPPGARTFSTELGDASRRPPPLDPGATRVDPDGVVVASAVRGLEGKDLGVAVVRFSLAAENIALERARGGILRFCIALGLGTATLLGLLARTQLVRPLVRLAAAARRVEAGEAGVHVDVPSRDEVGQLAVAFNAMSASVVDRELKLDQARGAVVELLDNMRQAIVVFGDDGRVQGVHSRACEVALGRADVEGVSLVDLLFPGVEAWHVERNALAEWVRLAFQSPREMWEQVEGLAPREITLEAGTDAERVLELDFRALGEGAVERIMLLATDVTAKRRLEREADAQAGEVAALKRLVGAGSLFVTFLESSRQRVASSRAALAATIPTSAEVSVASQQVHTIKGEAASFDQSVLVRAAGDVEHTLAVLRGCGGSRAAEERAAALAGLETLEAALDAARDRFVELSPLGVDALHRVEVDRRDIAALAAAAEGGAPASEVKEIASRLASRPFGELVGLLPERVASWADALGKRVQVSIQGARILVPAALAAVLPGAVAHLTRNAVAHGIELPDDRVRRGKPRMGNITVACEAGPRGLVVWVEDDGAGLPEGTPVERLFEAGFTTDSAVSALSGFGMGLGAVRADLARAGFAVVLTGTGRGTRAGVVAATSGLAERQA